MGSPNRWLKAENKALRFGLVKGAVEERRAANRRTFYKWLAYACGIGFLLGASAMLILILLVK